MKKSVICIALAAVTLAACNNTEKEARARLNNAKSMYERNELFAAKSEIDSIRALYPKEFKVLKEGLSLMRMVEMKEAERNILANPFKRFEDMQMLRHTKTLGVVQVDDAVWKKLTKEEKAEMERICDQKLAEYFEMMG